MGEIQVDLKDEAKHSCTAFTQAKMDTSEILE